MARGNRIPREEVQRRVELARRLIAAGLHDGEIKKAVAAQFGCSPRSVERHIRAAREELYERRNRTKRELQAESMAYYESVLQSNTASHHAKLQARKRIDELLGLEEPRKHEVAGPEGGPIPTNVTVQFIGADEDEEET